MRLIEIRSNCSMLSSLGLTGSCKAIMCLELAAVLCGHHVERVSFMAITSCDAVYLHFLWMPRSLHDSLFNFVLFRQNLVCCFVACCRNYANQFK